MPLLTSLFLTLAFAQTPPASPEPGAAAPPSPLPASATCEAALGTLEGLALTREQEKSWDKRQKHFMGQLKAMTTADQLNTLGMRCYKEKRFVEAGQLFEWATALAPTHALANYNLACVIGLLLKTQGPCDMDLSWENVFHNLQQAIASDPKRRERARVDTDLDSLREMMAFRLTVEGPPKSAAETAALYDGVTLWGETPGAALLGKVSFQRTHPSALTGTVSGWVADWDFHPMPVKGTWRAEGEVLIVDWAQSRSKDGTQTRKGSTERIRLDEMNRYGHGGWYTTPDWCSA